jgi:RimJ/RimL family protein N-acetyltransferase
MGRIMIMIIYGKNINLRTVEIDDAEFVFNMRQNPNRVKYLTKITGTIESQHEWIKIVSRGKEGKEYYFVIESEDGEKLGLVRMYDF